MKETFKLISILFMAIALAVGRSDLAVFNGVETRLQATGALSTLALTQTFMGGNSVVELPTRIRALLEHKAVRASLLFMTVFSIIRDLEISVLIAIAYVTLIQLVRTPEERKRHPYFI